LADNADAETGTWARARREGIPELVCPAMLLLRSRLRPWQQWIQG